ncbi:glycoside hydrolase family 99-like domain-containing protein [Mesorhizobium sp.]|uniref:glycoside hydrolase family 99-like domain-containing protein n=1 Tax=Mesorhizobium sp. TaxID=1871066 RepID=UPI0025E49D00|nr:glycoside hydrolase family 99-like domain-containing protein [Mesorhizobium sp.]
MNRYPSSENLRTATPDPQASREAAPKARVKTKPVAAKRTCIMVLGMHRSGTSALTRAISLLGAELPKNMLGANSSNPAGHWEPARLIELHDQMLTEAGSRWDDWRSFDPADLGARRLRFYKAEIARLIDEEYGSAPLFVLKEPRISRFVPLYADILKRMRIDVRYVLIRRNPLAVIASLANRDGFTTGFSSLLWLRHELEAEHATRDRPRIFLSYEALLDDWREGIDAITNALKIDWPLSKMEWQSLLATHFSKDDQHFAASADLLDADAHIADWVKEVYGALMLLEKNSSDAMAMAQFDTVSIAFNSGSSVFGEAVFPEMNARALKAAHESTQLRRLVDERTAEIDQQISKLHEEAAEREAQLTQQHREGVAKDEELARQNGAFQLLIAERSADVEALEREREQNALAQAGQLAEIGALREEIASARDAWETVASTIRSAAERERQELEAALARSQAESAGYANSIGQLRNSTSWRVTGPIRAAKQLLAGRRGHVGPLLRFGRQVMRRLPVPVNLKHNVKLRLLRYDLIRRAGNLTRVSTLHSFEGDATNMVTPLALADGAYIHAEYIAQVLAIAKHPAGTDLAYVPRSEEVIDFARAPLKLMAFYLPQFHPIPENDEWWGRGFTEWTNVAKAVPQYIGQYQPHLPGELGYYDLRVVDVMRQQVALAKSYGVAGFCFHHYWFGGKRLLEKPVLQLLENPDIDIEFCLCWANENWTRRWDGQEQDVLMAQQHSPSDDIAFLDDIIPALRDRRYLRQGGRAVLIVYRANLLPDPAATAARWRERAKDAGLGDLYLVAAQTFGILDPRPFGFDAAIEFPPHMGMASGLNDRLKIVNPNFRGQIYDYEELAASYSKNKRTPYQLLKTVTPSWDNEARKPGAGHSFYGASPPSYAKWLRKACEITVDNMANNSAQPPLVFVNAWNEWAEGAHLEPDRKFGYGYLHATASVIRDLIPPDSRLVELVERSQKTFCKRSRSAIVLHLHYDDLFEDIREHLSNAGDSDLLISVRRDAPGTVAERILDAFPNARLTFFRNRGRDIQPFLQLLPFLLSEGYDVGCKVHSKKSLHRRDGAVLRGNALKALLGSPQCVKQIIQRFNANSGLGLLAPAGSLLDLGQPDRNVLNRGWLDRLLPRLGMTSRIGRYDMVFPAGSMFWFRPEALRPLADLGLGPDEFEDEVGQIDGTLAHAIERLTAAVALESGYSVSETDYH